MLPSPALIMPFSCGLSICCLCLNQASRGPYPFSIWARAWKSNHGEVMRVHKKHPQVGPSRSLKKHQTLEVFESCCFCDQGCFLCCCSMVTFYSRCCSPAAPGVGLATRIQSGSLRSTPVHSHDTSESCMEFGALRLCRLDH